MLRTIDYKNLETRVHRNVKANIVFKPEDKIQLRVGITEGKPTVEIVMPWNNIYRLGTYKTEEQARQAFQKYDSNLKEGYSIRIIGNSTAEILQQ